MTFDFLSANFFLLARESKQSFRSLLWLLVAMLVPLPSVQANEENEESFVTEFSMLTEDNLPQYVSRISHRYYEQVEMLGRYFQLYQQKRDPRGFNVWHLRGFSPKFNALNDENQLIAKANEAFLSDRPETALTTIFAELRDVSVNLMVAFRDNDPEAFKLANAKVKEHNEQIATLLRAHNLDKEIRDISLN
ncbi:hypothetical protein [Methylophaga sp.]|uniref:hypothetical protein n=1 Tax=Methylophaga sp. TaxID=2024840 RepID=UPI003A8E600A